MSIKMGAVFPYTKYRAHFNSRPPHAVTWKWADIVNSLKDSTHTERGTLTLTSNGEAEGCELLPGAAVSLQIVKAGESTRPHAHSWWHFFVVQNGTGTMTLGAGQTSTSLNRGDVVIVPAWCAHSIQNGSLQDDLILMSLTNLPQQAGLSNLFAQEPEDQSSPDPIRHDQEANHVPFAG